MKGKMIVVQALLQTTPPPRVPSTGPVSSASLSSPFATVERRTWNVLKRLVGDMQVGIT